MAIIAFCILVSLVSLLLGSMLEARYQWMAVGRAEAVSLWAGVHTRLTALEEQAAVKKAAVEQDAAKLAQDFKL